MRAAGLMLQLDNLMNELQTMHNIDIPPGYNPDLRYAGARIPEVPTSAVQDMAKRSSKSISSQH